MSNRSIITPEVDAQYQSELLMRANFQLLHEQFAKDLSIEARGGSRVARFRRYVNINPATTPLTEGVSPSGSSPTIVNITKTLAQYGDFIPFNDVVTLESVDPVIAELSGISGDQMGETKDVLCRESLHAGTSVFYGGGRVSRVTVATGDNLTQTMLDKVVEGLKAQKAKKVTPMINASDKINTSPVASSYIGYCNPNGTRQIKALSSFVSVEKYSSTMSILPGEVGKTDDIRWIETNNGKVFTGAGSGGIDVVSMVVFGAEAYGKVPMNDSTAEMILKPLGSSGSSDPLNQRGTVGWKTTTGYLILNDNFISRIEVAKLP